MSVKFSKSLNCCQRPRSQTMLQPMPWPRSWQLESQLSCQLSHKGTPPQTHFDIRFSWKFVAKMPFHATIKPVSFFVTHLYFWFLFKNVIYDKDNLNWQLPLPAWEALSAFCSLDPTLSPAPAPSPFTKVQLAKLWWCNWKPKLKGITYLELRLT